MQLVDASSIRTSFSNTFPRVIEVKCPHCLKEADFEVRCWQEHGRHLAAAEAPCARCEGMALFVQLLDDSGSAAHTPLYRNPPSPERVAVSGLGQLRELSAPLGRSYDSALKLYNRGEWGPAALTVRHLLESLVSRLLDGNHRDAPLPAQLEALPEAVDLGRPLRDIARLLADDGGFGRQLDDEAAIDPFTVGQLLELTEQLITYLVVVPGAMDELKGRIATAPVPLRRGNHLG